jgi:hypothetical protein
MAKLAICTGSDTNLFYLAKGLVLSLRRVLPLYDAELVFFDLGCKPQELAWLEARTKRIIVPKDDLGVADLPGFAPHKLGLTIRPFLPSYAPGFDIYLWIDADAWVQDPGIIRHYIKGAEAGGGAVTLELDVAYRWYLNRPLPYHNYKINAWTEAYGAQVAHALGVLPLVNAGIYAINAKPFIWEKWAENFSQVVQGRMAELCDQLALQKTLVEHNRLYALPSRANWMSHYALPEKQPDDGLWIEPRFGGQPIGIVHLVAEKMREIYLRHGLLYDGGDYLSPEEVPETLRAAFLTGRRRPIVEAPSRGGPS